jgi:hypothetical protein
VSMVVLGRRAEDIDELIEKLEAAGAFDGLLASQMEEADGLMRAVVEGWYVPVVEAPEKGPEPAPATKGAGL